MCVHTYIQLNIYIHIYIYYVIHVCMCDSRFFSSPEIVVCHTCVYRCMCVCVCVLTHVRVSLCLHPAQICGFFRLRKKSWYVKHVCMCMCMYMYMCLDSCQYIHKNPTMHACTYLTHTCTLEQQHKRLHLRPRSRQHQFHLYLQT
jgi:hypothetical protein